jgi:hypothetical protein
MLLSYVTHNRNELLAILKIKDPEFAAMAKAQPRAIQIEMVKGHPTIKICLYYHLLGELGFSVGSILESRITRALYVVEFANITSDTGGDPACISIFGREKDSRNNDFTPTLIGRIEDFVSADTGQCLSTHDLKNYLDLER